MANRSKGRVKKYVQNPIPAGFSEKGGFSARFVSDGFSVDAKEELLPQVIKEEGIQIGLESAWGLICAFFKKCANHTATTGETVNIGTLGTIYLAIRGWFAKKTSKATPENVRVLMKLLDDMRPTCVFSMSNVNEGNTLAVSTVMSPGCKLGEVRQGATVTINGRWLKMIDDGTGADHVTAEVSLTGGQKVGATCPVVESEDDHVTVTLPGAFSGAELVGKSIVFTVYGRTGDPEAGVQDASITATLLDGGAEVRPFVDKIATVGKDGIQKGQPFEATGGNLGDYGEGCSTTVKWTQDGEEKELELTPSAVAADKLTYAAVPEFESVPDNTELTFEIAFPNTEAVVKNAVLLAAE